MANCHMMSSSGRRKKEGGVYRPLRVQQQNHLEVDRLRLLNPPSSLDDDGSRHSSDFVGETENQEVQSPLKNQSTSIFVEERMGKGASSNLTWMLRNPVGSLEEEVKNRSVSAHPRPECASQVECYRSCWTSELKGVPA